MIVDVIASRTASAPCPARARPFLTLSRPRSAMRGRWSSIVNRVVRSTNVPIAERPRPMMRSPSQCPGTARSSASAGRALIMMSGPTNSLPRPRRRALGARSARLAGRPSARGAVPPAPGCAALGQSPRARPSSIHRRATRSGADGRSAAGSTMSPMSVLAAAMTSTTPGAHVWTRHGRPVLSHHVPARRSCT